MEYCCDRFKHAVRGRIVEEVRAGKACKCSEFNGLFCEILEDKNAVGNEDNESLAYEVHREV